ncbi:uncharacterized protein LOC106471080 isoform X2 [Limulus polyphemus]|nr:uncharacterized protein LOC106471080 isoform X2 [Limulus polyphemus]
MAQTAPSRPMKYPYTFSAKIAQFPYKFHFTKNWFLKYYIFGFALSYPIFLYIHKKVNSPAAVAAWEERQRKIAAEEHHH